MAGIDDAVNKLQSLVQAVSGVANSLSNAAQLTPSYAVAVSGITVGVSPFSYKNAGKSNVDIIVDGGTVSAIAYSRDGTNFFTTGLTAGMFSLSPGDTLKVTYSATPTMTLVPR